METFFYDEKLADLILNKMPLKTTKITIISGYIGPILIEKLLTNINKTKNIIKVKIYIGMYGKGISCRLHEELLKINNKYDNLNIYYTNKLVHTKMYLYKDKNDIYLNKLIGSANFSTTLYVDKKEVLTVAQENPVIISEINNYCQWVATNATAINNFTPAKKCELLSSSPLLAPDEEVAVDLEDNVASDDAATKSVPKIFVNHIPIYNLNRNFYCSAKKRCNVIIPLKPQVIAKIKQFNYYSPEIWNLEIFEILWDDGTLMLAKFEGKQEIDNKTYPLGIVSNDPLELETYLHNRIETKLQTKIAKITPKILDAYGTSMIMLSHISADVFAFTFSEENELELDKEIMFTSPATVDKTSPIKKIDNNVKISKTTKKAQKKQARAFKAKLKHEKEINKEIWAMIKAKNKQ